MLFWSLVNCNNVFNQIVHKCRCNLVCFFEHFFFKLLFFHIYQFLCQKSVVLLLSVHSKPSSHARNEYCGQTVIYWYQRYSFNSFVACSHHCVDRTLLVDITIPVIIVSFSFFFGLFWNTSVFSLFPPPHSCASTSLPVCAESQVEAKIKNDYKQMYLYRSILKEASQIRWSYMWVITVNVIFFMKISYLW